MRKEKSLKASFKHRFLKKGLDWVLQLEALPNTKEQVVISLMYYIGIEDSEKSLQLNVDHKALDAMGISNGEQIRVDGSYPEDPEDEIGSAHEFSLIVEEDKENKSPSYSEAESKLESKPDLSKTQFVGYSLTQNVWQGFEMAEGQLIENMRFLIQEYMRAHGNEPIKKQPLLAPTLPNSLKVHTNFVIFRKYFVLPAKINFLLHSKPKSANGVMKRKLLKSAKEIFLSAERDRLFSMFSRRYLQQFDSKYALSKVYSHDKYLSFSRFAHSNLIGGLGYYSGTWLKQEPLNNGDVVSEQAPTTVFTCSPSRSFFPRGFLWDEGFHQLVLLHWDKRITMDVISHWLRLADESGWIPREQILGSEARSRVPDKFVPQNPIHGNPPTLFLVIEKLVDQLTQKVDNSVLEDSSDKFGSTTSEDDRQSIIKFLGDNFESMKRWYNWFRETQKGKKPYSFYWRGRTVNHTLASGLDDYPRAFEPSEEEMHLDLFCWMAISNRVLSKVQSVLFPNEKNEFSEDIPNFQKHLEGILSLF